MKLAKLTALLFITCIFITGCDTSSDSPENLLNDNIIYDKERSDESLQDMQKSIPLALGVAQKGQKIIDRGEIVTEAKYRIIESFQKENNFSRQF